MKELKLIDRTSTTHNAASLGNPRWRLVILVLPLADIFIRLAPLLRSRLAFAYKYKDSWQYIELADGLNHGCGFARLLNGACGPPELLRTPGYPLFLAGMPNLRTALAVQALLAGIVCLLVGFWVARCWGVAAGVVAEFLIAFDISSIVVTGQLMSEQQFQILLLLALVPPLLMIGSDSELRNIVGIAVLSGCAAALAVMTRPIGILLPVIIPIPFLLLRSVRMRYRVAIALLVFAIPALTMLGWSQRNYREAGYFGLSTVGGVNLYYYRAAEVLERTQGSTLAAAQMGLDRQLGVPFNQIFEARNQSPELEKRLSELSWQIFIAHPLETFEMTLQGFLYNAGAPMRSELSAWLLIGQRHWGLNSKPITVASIEVLIAKILASPLMTCLVTIQIILLAAIWIGVVLALIRCFRSPLKYRAWSLYLTGVALLFLLLASGGEACQRFRVPVIPILAIVAGMGYFGHGTAETRGRQTPYQSSRLRELRASVLTVGGGYD